MTDSISSVNVYTKLLPKIISLFNLDRLTDLLSPLQALRWEF